MDFFMTVIVVVSLISTGIAKPIKVRKRLSLLENRVKTLETRLNIESDYTQEVYSHVTEINATLKELQTACQHASTYKTAETKHTGIISPAPFPDAIERILAAFDQVKGKLRSTTDTMEHTLAEIQLNMTKETEQNIQTVITDYNDLNLKVQKINLTLVALLDEMQQYITSDKKNTTLLSAELKSNQENTALLSAKLQSNKQNTSLLSVELQSYKQNTALLSAELKSCKENTSLLSAELKSYKENTALLSAELKSNKENTTLLVSRLGQIEKALIAMGQNFSKDLQDMATSFDSKYKRKTCSNLWNSYNIFCYRLFEISVTYSEAQQKCENSSAYVVDIQNQSEQDFVTNLTRSKSVGHYWIGLTDLKKEDNWKWDRTKSPASFLSWGPGQPNNRRDEICVLADTGSGWHDYPCSVKINFVCKKTL